MRATGRTMVRRSSHPHVGDRPGYLLAVAEDQGESLADMVRSFLEDDEVALLPQHRAAEPRRNTWSYSVAPGPIDVAGVVAALNDVAAELRRRFASHAGVATFYAWYDGQAGQLRCSLGSVGPESLPFGAPYVAVEDAADVVRLAATDPSRGEVSWSDLADIVDEPKSPRGEPLDPFPVWTVILDGPAGSAGVPRSP